MRRARRLAVGAAVAAMTAWAAAALYYWPPDASGGGAVLALLFAAVTVAAFVGFRRRRRLVLAGFLAAFAGLVAVWLGIPPSNHRDWQPEVAVAPRAVRAGERVTIHGVRNFDYRTETDFVPRWETRTYDLAALDSLDLVAVYWAGKAVAHIMLSFGFGGRDFVAVSIETRRERHERYATLPGFFKQYELVYVVADERDVLRVRTTYRQPQEDVYLYRVRAIPDRIRAIFLDYVREMNELHARPRFYNTLTSNCTTDVLVHTRVVPEGPRWSWKVLLSGYAPEYAYELGWLDTSRPFPELERLSRINRRAHAAGADPAFSQRVREGLPVPGAARGATPASVTPASTAGRPP